jgi:hypothetical protein
MLAISVRVGRRFVTAFKKGHSDERLIPIKALAPVMAEDLPCSFFEAD